MSPAEERAGSEQAELLDALLAGLRPIAEEMVARIRAEVPSFAAVPRQEHLDDTLVSLELLLRGSLGDSTGTVDIERLDALGRRRADQGVPVDDVLEAWRLAVRIGAAHARAIAEQRGIPPEPLLASFQGALEVANEVVARLASGHRSSPGTPRGEERDFVLAALAGSSPVEQLRGGASARGLDLSRRYRALRGRGIGEEGCAELRRRLGRGEGDGLLVVAEEGVAGFSTVLPERADTGLLAVGPEVAFENLPASDRIAARIVAAGARLGLVGVHDLASAGLLVAVLESGDVGEALFERYVAPARAVQGGEELIGSLRAWLDAGMRVGPAAERLHIHPNTLRYRLGRYRDLTGADLTVTEELVGVWWAVHRDLLARPGGPGPGAA